MNKKYFNEYLSKLSRLLINFNHDDFLRIVKLMKKVKKDRKKVILVGNGGSAAMASHVSVD